MSRPASPPFTLNIRAGRLFIDMPTSAFSRPAVSNPFGKCTRERKIHLDEATDDALVAMATVQGIPVSEHVRQILQAHVHGYMTMLRHAVGSPGIGAESGGRDDG